MHILLHRKRRGQQLKRWAQREREHNLKKKTNGILEQVTETFLICNDNEFIKRLQNQVSKGYLNSN